MCVMPTSLIENRNNYWDETISKEIGVLIRLEYFEFQESNEYPGKDN